MAHLYRATSLLRYLVAGVVHYISPYRLHTTLHCFTALLAALCFTALLVVLLLEDLVPCCFTALLALFALEARVGAAVARISSCDRDSSPPTGPPALLQFCCISVAGLLQLRSGGITSCDRDLDCSGATAPCHRRTPASPPSTLPLSRSTCSVVAQRVSTQ